MLSLSKHAPRGPEAQFNLNFDSFYDERSVLASGHQTAAEIPAALAERIMIGALFGQLIGAAQAARNSAPSSRSCA